jgi:RNA polymerase sigma factor FliA
MRELTGLDRCVSNREFGSTTNEMSRVRGDVRLTTVLDAYGNWNKQKNDELIEQHLPLVYRMAQRVVNATHLGTLEFGDLVHVGVLGMYKALEKFDIGRGVTFGSYAAPYVRGSMLDEVQRHRQIPRAIRDKDKQVRVAINELSQSLLRTPTDEELAKHLGLSTRQLGNWMTDIEWTTIWSVDELESNGVFEAADDRMEASPEHSFDLAERTSMLTSALKKLSLREQQVLYAYYQEELTLKEIAYVMELSESQISRIHSKAILRLRGMIGRKKTDVMGGLGTT